MNFTLDEIHRVASVMIDWKLAPEKFIFQISQNGYTFEKIKEFDLSAKSF